MGTEMPWRPVAQMMTSMSWLLPSTKCTVRPSMLLMPGRGCTLPARISFRMSPVPGLMVGCTCAAKHELFFKPGLL